MEDPLESLLVSSADLNRELLAHVLSRWVRIDRESGEMIPLPEWNDLRSRQRILVFLLAGKAAAALNILTEETFLPRQVVAGTGMPPGTVKRELREMIRARLLAQGDSGGYYVPAFALQRAQTVIGGDTDGDTGDS